MAKEMLIRAALDISLAMKNIASVQDNECFLLNIILKWMAKITEKPGATKHFVQNDKVLSCTSRSSVERLLCEWIDGSGETVRALLELPESVCIADMMYIAMADKEGGNDGAETCEAGFAALLLGICLEYVVSKCVYCSAEDHFV